MVTYKISANNNLIIERINRRGNKKKIDNKEIYLLSLDFIMHDYKVKVQNNDLVLSNSSVTFLIENYEKNLNNKYLSLLKLSLKKKLNLESSSWLKKVKNKLFYAPKLQLASFSLAALTLIYPLFSSFHSKNVSFDSNITQSDLDFENPEIEFLKETEVEEEKNVEIEELKPVEKERIDLEQFSLEQSYVIRSREILSKEQLNTLVNYMCNNNPFGIHFDTYQDVINHLYFESTRTSQEKMLIIMARENLTYEQLDHICAGAIPEAGHYYDETYRWASVLFNRNHCERWVNYCGEGLYTQYTFPGQFDVCKNAYLPYCGLIEDPGYLGVIDMLYSRVPSIDYTSYRGKDTIITKYYEQYLSFGNKFFDDLKDEIVIEDEYMSKIAQELSEDAQTLGINEEKVLTRKYVL